MPTFALLRNLAMIAVVIAVLVFQAGDYPWIQGTAFYQVLSVFVALNTLGFAMAASIKAGLRSGRALSTRSAAQ